MAATGNEAVTLAQLKAFSDSIPSGGGGTDLKFEMVQILNPTSDEWISTPGGSCQFKFVNFQPLAVSFASIYLPNVFEFIPSLFVNYNNKVTQPPAARFKKDSKSFIVIDRDSAWEVSALEPLESMVVTSFEKNGVQFEYCGNVYLDMFNSERGGDFEIAIIFNSVENSYYAYTGSNMEPLSLASGDTVNKITIPMNRIAYPKSS